MRTALAILLAVVCATTGCTKRLFVPGVSSVKTVRGYRSTKYGDEHWTIQNTQRIARVLHDLKHYQTGWGPIFWESPAWAWTFQLHDESCELLRIWVGRTFLMTTGHRIRTITPAEADALWELIYAADDTSTVRRVEDYLPRDITDMMDLLNQAEDRFWDKIPDILGSAEGQDLNKARVKLRILLKKHGIEYPAKTKPVEPAASPYVLPGAGKTSGDPAAQQPRKSPTRPGGGVGSAERLRGYAPPPSGWPRVCSTSNIGVGINEGGRSMTRITRSMCTLAGEAETKEQPTTPRTLRRVPRRK